LWESQKIAKVKGMKLTRSVRENDRVTASIAITAADAVFESLFQWSARTELSEAVD
jgi:hypothetical protein